MILIGAILLVFGAILDIGLLYTIGGVLAAIGVLLWLAGEYGHQIGPRAHYF